MNALLGGQAADDLSAPGGTPSQLRGGPGDDVLTGGTRDDIIAGEAGNDDITGGPGVDSLDGGPGDDFVDSFDGTADALVACGDGADDRLFADNTLDLSVASGCETVAPEFATAPSIAGDPRIGGVLSYAGAVISGSPSTLAFAWIRCRDAGLACDVIPGATGSAYSVGPADVGSALQLVVTATNAAGTDAAASSPTATVPALVPTAPSAAPPPSTLVAPPATVAPAPSPTPRVPARLRLAVVTVVGRPTVKLRRRAQRLDTGRRATCPPGPEPCRVDVVATVAPRGSEKTYRRTIAGRGSVTLAGGRSARLSFRLTKRAALLLRRTERLRLKLAITSRRGSSSSRTSRATISVRAPVARQ